MTPADAETFGVKDKDIVAVKIESAERTAILCDTVIRVSDKFALAMHIDTGPRIETFASSFLGPTTVTLSSQAN